MTNDEKLLARIADLKIQAMLFDMDVDYETLTLTETVKQERKPWLDKWKDKRNTVETAGIDMEE